MYISKCLLQKVSVQKWALKVSLVAAWKKLLKEGRVFVAQLGMQNVMVVAFIN